MVYRALLKRKLFDWSFHPAVRWTVAAGLYGAYLLSGADGRTRSFRYLLAAHRYAAGQRASQVYQRQIRRNLYRWLQAAQVSSVGGLTEGQIRSFHRRTLVLKPPRFENGQMAEKGVLFTKTHWELARLCRMESLLEHYTLVIEPGWSGYADPHILYFCRFAEHPIVVCAPEITDYELLKHLDTNLIPVQFGASDWVNPRVFRPLEGVPKEFDGVMVAGWGVYKRHHALFRALRAIREDTYRFALVGEEWKGVRSEIEGLIDLYGVRRKVIIFQHLSPEGVNEVLNRSKVNLILTLREGANKSIFEGFFADVPGVVLRNNIGINKSYINQHTGMLIEERDLPQVLVWFRDNYRQFHPREWAMQNIAPEVTTAKLNAVLRELAGKRGEPWTRDIVAKTNCPDPTYYPGPSVAEGFPTVEDILQKYGQAQA